MRRFDRRYALWGVALVALALLPAFAGFAGIGWELCQIAGLLGCLGCVLLCGAPLRPRDAVPPTLLSLRAHSLIGWLVLAAVLLHVAGLLITDRVVFEYLKPSAPLYQLAGIGAAVLLLILVVGSAGPLRQHLWKKHRAFQATHVTMGCALIALTCMHVVATDRYTAGHGRRALLLAAGIAALLLLLRPRRPGPGDANAASPQRQLVFGRNSRWVLVAAALASVALTGLIADATGRALREPVAQTLSSGSAPHVTAVPLDFPHGKHVAVNCLTCHHNFADGRGMDTCVSCHKSARTDLKLGVQARFHSFCFECHRHPDPTLTHHGPVAGCDSCHRTPAGAS